MWLLLIVLFLNCRSNLSLTEQCFEFLFLVTTAQEDGAMTFYRSGGMNVLASQMHALPDGNQFGSLVKQFNYLLNLINLLEGHFIHFW